MDTVNDERGQAIVIAVFAFAIVATVIAGLRVAQDRVLDGQNERRAGEAAVEAATAVIVDAYIAEIRRVASSSASPAPSPDVIGAITSTGSREAARIAATTVSLANGGHEIDEVTVRCDKAIADVALRISGTAYRAGFPVVGCFPR